MTQFKLHTLETAPEGSKGILEEAQKQNGFIPNFNHITHTPLDKQIEAFKWEPSSD
ncbi:MAG: hypothetical protein K0B11_17005 [Mariniphaga sp.]|nr:hypothetical protein [Mariniphaga sp.]